MGHRIVKVWQLGRIGYLKALKLQNLIAKCHQESPEEICNTLLILEHPPVYTIGIRKKEYEDLDVDSLKKKGAEFFETNRGGLITFHGPGQLVAYPVINLKYFKSSMRWYVCHIEKSIIDLCSKFNVNATTSPHTGVWVGDNKICAIGVHGSRFITTHGLALNCNIDLDWFKYIVPCGIADKGVTSLSEVTKNNVELETVTPLFVDSFCTTFNCIYVDMPSGERDFYMEKLARF